MSENIDLRRRRFFGAAGMTVAAAQLALSGSARAESGKAKPAELPADQARDAHVVRYAEADRCRRPECRLCRSGSRRRPAVILLHGWPYDIHSYVDVAPLLASAGYRVIVPYLRGYGTTRFLSDETVRNGQQSALALDIIALMDALKIEKATLAGFDWGARTADIVAALWPERCKALVSVSGYLIGSQEAGKMPLPPKAELQWWYQYYFATERGRAGYDKYRHDFAKLIWQIASPKWDFDDATFDRTRGGLRQSGSRRHRHPQLPLAARPGRRRAEIRRSGKAACRSPRHHGARPSPWKAMPMARHIRSPAPTPRNSRANMRTGPSRAASGTTCRRKPRRPLPKPSSKSPRSDRPWRGRRGHCGAQPNPAGV